MWRGNFANHASGLQGKQSGWVHDADASELVHQQERMFTVPTPARGMQMHPSMQQQPLPHGHGLQAGMSGQAAGISYHQQQSLQSHWHHQQEQHQAMMYQAGDAQQCHQYGMGQFCEPEAVAHIGGWFGRTLMGAATALSGGEGGMNNVALAGVVANQMHRQYHQAGSSTWLHEAQGLRAGIKLKFNVGHEFVLRKLLLLVFPFLECVGLTIEISNAQAPSELKVDSEEADLYIPLMAYITYVLVFGIQRITLDDFQPDVLSATATFALVIIILELAVTRIGFHLAGRSVPTLDILANCGYKFVLLVLMIFCRILWAGTLLYYVAFVYFSACTACCHRRFLFHLRASSLHGQYDIRLDQFLSCVIAGLVVAQVPLCWLLTPSNF